jgi:uncharacterized lipoprotein YddW (UPF0748 family)
MISDRSGIARALAGAAVVVCLAASAHGRVQRPPDNLRSATSPVSEIRALWVLRSSLASPESIAALVRSAKLHGFNTLFVQVRGRGDAYYGGTLEPRAAALAGQPAAFDPLADVLKAAQAAGLRVHAWINVNLISSAVDLPRARDHLVYRRPDWLMVPRELGQALVRVDPASPGYLGRIARWTRAQSADVEGLYTSPVSPAAVEHLAAVARDIVRRYPLDGVHFDYARYPNETFDYSRTALREFRASVIARLAPARRRELAAREAEDAFAFPDALPEDWRRFRVARMTALLRRLRDVVKAERPHAAVSVAAAADVQEALERKFQNWPEWLEAGIIDAVCPMAYTTEPGRFAEQITAAVAAASERPVWAGIGAYRLSPEQTIDNIATARRLGARGIVLFSYDSLIEPRQRAADYLGLVARAAFAHRGANGGSR